MPQIPGDKILDSTLAFAYDGYEFVSNRCERYDSDIFQTRLMLQKTICMRGEEAAELIYDNERFKREGGVPRRIKKTLFGEGGVQGKDGETHRRRKEMFMSLMTPEGIQDLVELAANQWNAYLDEWEKREEVVLFYEVREILCRAVCSWVGVPLQESEVKKRSDDFGAMIDGSGAVGLRHWRGRLGRGRAERWISSLVEEVRAGKLEVPEESAFHRIAWYRDPDGELLEERVAAVELLNVLRPTVAVDRYVAFMAHALHEHPEVREKLESDEYNEYEELFVQEVRRFYPFFPFVAALVRHDFEWNGYHFPDGAQVVLDLYGTNHDPDLWEDPNTFRPERFRDWDGSAYNFVPQGGGDHHQHHRCPGEWITIALMKRALRFLTREMTYDVPEQDLDISLTRVPAIPKSRFVMSNVRRKA